MKQKLLALLYTIALFSFIGVGYLITTLVPYGPLVIVLVVSFVFFYLLFLSIMDN